MSLLKIFSKNEEEELAEFIAVLYAIPSNFDEFPENIESIS
jgi:hypothetical protein